MYNMIIVDMIHADDHLKREVRGNVFVSWKVTFLSVSF